MSDNSRRTPPLGLKKHPRTQSQTDRDMEGLAARREREAAIKEESFDDITGRYEGEELEERRRSRPPDERFSRLEKKHDELKKDSEKKHDEVRTDVKNLTSQVGNLRADVAGAVGKIDGQEGVLTEMLGLVKKTAERDHVTFTAKVEVDKAHELAEIEVDKAQELAEIEDTIKAKDARRKRNLKLLGIVASSVASGGVLIEVLHRLGAL